MKKILSAIITWILTAAALLALLLLSALIPRDLLRKHAEASADLLCERYPFYEVWEGYSMSKIDRYADAILLNIAWHYDGKHPLRSVTESAYYYTDTQEETENFREAVAKDLPANREYVRYWHGSLIFVRPLLLILSLRGMYVFWALVLLLLLGSLMLRLIRRGEKLFAFGLLTGLLLTASWFVPMSLEYTWTYLVMFLMMHLILSLRSPLDCGIPVMMGGGVLCAFLDFLTTETLTLTLPLLLLLRLLLKKGVSTGKVMREGVGSALAWAFGYAGMMVCKWGLASLVLRITFRDVVTRHVNERLGGLVLDEAFFRPLGPVTKNWGALIPFAFGGAGVTAGCIALAAVLYFGYVYHVKHLRIPVLLSYLVIGLVPMARFLVLRNHSVIHFFFTYRALAVVFPVLFLMLGEVLGKEG